MWTKPYKSQYHRKDLLEALATPLYEDGKRPIDENKKASSQIHNELMFIYKSVSSKVRSYHFDTIEHLLDEQKLNVLTAVNAKDPQLKEFLKSKIFDKEMRGRCMLGLQANTFCWLMDVFRQISQSQNNHPGRWTIHTNKNNNGDSSNEDLTKTPNKSQTRAPHHRLTNWSQLTYMFSLWQTGTPSHIDLVYQPVISNTLFSGL